MEAWLYDLANNALWAARRSPLSRALFYRGLPQAFGLRADGIKLPEYLRRIQDRFFHQFQSSFTDPSIQHGKDPYDQILAMLTCFDALVIKFRKGTVETALVKKTPTLTAASSIYAIS